MGRKRSSTRQRLRVCLALLTLGSGCTIFEKPPAKAPPRVEPENTIVVPPEPVLPPQPEVTVEPAEVRERRETQESLQLAQQLMARGDYEGSLRESQKVLKQAKNQAPGDEALFNMGLVYVHPKNPKKDNRRAISFFNQVVKGYPDSPLTEQAKIWVGVLDGMEKLKQVDIEIEEKKRDRTR
jgi:tetratricopeptide (TPR) repeat protein